MIPQRSSLHVLSRATASTQQHRHDNQDNSLLLPPPRQATMMIRCFETEAAYHRIADATLHGLQDAVEHALEDSLNDAPDDMDISLASGVLTIALPPHGTWVLNKQTPNQVRCLFLCFALCAFLQIPFYFNHKNSFITCALLFFFSLRHTKPIANLVVVTLVGPQTF